MLYTLITEYFERQDMIICQPEKIANLKVSAQYSVYLELNDILTTNMGTP
jgi:hypothetical protein